MIKTGAGFLCISAGRIKREFFDIVVEDIFFQSIIVVMKKVWPLVCLFLLTGCAKLAHLQELLTLQDLSLDRDQQDAYVKNHDESFERLLTAVKNNSLNQFPDQKSFLKTIGKPVLIKKIVLSGESMERWLYRRTKQSFDSPKVYLYFDQFQKLRQWEYFPREENVSPSSGMIAQTTTESKPITK